MDFMPQLASMLFLTPVVFLLLEKKFSHVPFLLACAASVYYQSIGVFLPLLILYFFSLLKTKNWKQLLLLIIVTGISVLYFGRNFYLASIEPDWGGVHIQFPLAELTSLLPIRYGPSFSTTGPFPVTTLFSSKEQLLVRILFFAAVTSSLVYIFLQKKVVSEDWKKLCFFSLLQCGFFVVAYVFLRPYGTYKVFSLGYLIFLPLLIRILSWLKEQREQYHYFIITIILILNLMVNIDQGVVYHNNWLRNSNQTLYASEPFQSALRTFQDRTVLIHQNIAFKSLFGMYVTEQTLYTTNGYIDNNYQIMERDINRTGNLCDFSLYSPGVVSLFLVEDGACVENTVARNLPYHNISNRKIQQFVAHP
jgi:hypothetical protein